MHPLQQKHLRSHLPFSFRNHSSCFMQVSHSLLNSAFQLVLQRLQRPAPLVLTGLVHVKAFHLHRMADIPKQLRANPTQIIPVEFLGEPSHFTVRVPSQQSATISPQLLYTAFRAQHQARIHEACRAQYQARINDAKPHARRIPSSQSCRQPEKVSRNA